MGVSPWSFAAASWVFGLFRSSGGGGGGGTDAGGQLESLASWSRPGAARNAAKATDDARGPGVCWVFFSALSLRWICSAELSAWRLES